MIGSLKKLLYIGAEIVNKLVPFLALPIFANYLSSEEFGVISNFNVLFFIFSIFIGLSTEGYLSVKFYNSSPIKRRLIIGNLILIATATLMLMIPIVYLFSGLIFQYFYLNSLLLLYCILATYFSFLIRLYLIQCRFTESHIEFFVTQFSLVTLNIGLSLFAVIYLEDKLFARLGSLTFSYVALGIMVFFILRKHALFRFSLILSRKSLKFGVPLIPYQLAKWVRNGLDRLIITNIIGISGNGIYSYNFQISNIPSYIGSGVNSELTPVLFKALKNGVNGKMLMSILTPYVGIIAFSFLMYVGAVLLLKDVFFTQHFKFDIVLFSLVLFGSLFHSVALLLNNFFFFWEKNILVTRITVVASICSAIMNLSFTSIWGIFGTCLTFFVVEVAICILLVYLVILKIYNR